MAVADVDTQAGVEHVSAADRIAENVDGHAHTLVTLESILPTSLKMGVDILFHA